MHRSDLGDLTAFVAVADHLNFRAAASRLGITPSALSHAMRQLEDRLALPQQAGVLSHQREMVRVGMQGGEPRGLPLGHGLLRGARPELHAVARARVARTTVDVWQAAHDTVSGPCFEGSSTATSAPSASLSTVFMSFFSHSPFQFLVYLPPALCWPVVNALLSADRRQRPVWRATRRAAAACR